MAYLLGAYINDYYRVVQKKGLLLLLFLLLLLLFLLLLEFVLKVFGFC